MHTVHYCERASSVAFFVVTPAGLVSLGELPKGPEATAAVAALDELKAATAEAALALQYLENWGDSDGVAHRLIAAGKRLRAAAGIADVPPP